MLLGAGRQVRKESLDQYGEEKRREEKRREEKRREEKRRKEKRKEKKKVFHFAAASECTVN